jgi:hypothetical protein
VESQYLDVMTLDGVVCPDADPAALRETASGGLLERYSVMLIMEKVKGRRRRADTAPARLEGQTG